ncbi:MAG: hypothetical protein RB191_18205, partial [Terriglobia bacterium]|nr:hypothetical protein [Terriglobia bacterium]
QLSYASPSHPGNRPGVPKKARAHTRSAHTTAQNQRLAYRRTVSKPPRASANLGALRPVLACNTTGAFAHGAPGENTV